MQNQIYYFDIAEGRWQGEFSFRIERWKEFIGAPISLVDRALALVLHVSGLLPGKARMEGEILGAPDEGEAGVARVEVAVTRLGLEIFRLSGHYALAKDGEGVDIAVLERFGPPGFPVRGPERRDATIDRGGYRATYRIETLGARWEGVYDLNAQRDHLSAKYRSDWGTIGEVMSRTTRVVPLDLAARRRWERLLDLARRMEALNRTFDLKTDPRASFAHVYSVVTRNLAFTLDDAGFDDPSWVIRLAEHFAGLYFAAVDAWPSGTAPRAWSMVLDAISRHRFTALEAFLLQMFVHIVHDLPRALVTAGLTKPNGSSRIDDYHRVNELLTAAIDELQSRLGLRYNLVITALDRILLRFDETLAADRIAEGRAAAWYDAERMLDPDTRYHAIAELDARVRTVVDNAVGTTIPARLLMRAFRTGVRALRLEPLDAPPASSLGAVKIEEAPEPTSAALYSLFTAIAAKREKASLPDLAGALFTDEMRGMLGSRALALLAPLGGEDAWRDELPRLLERSPSDRYTLASLIGDLLEGDELARALGGLRVSKHEHAAIRSFQDAVAEMLADTAQIAGEAIARATAALEALGIPTHVPLLGFAHLKTHYDPATGIFHTTVPACFRVPFDEIQHVIAPADWDDSIKQVVKAEWVIEDEILYEEVNILHPWLAEHPLHLRTHLRIRETRTPVLRKVDYRLEKSLDGSLDMDQGFISVESKGPNLSLVMIDKQLRVKNNPVLLAMLRFNPDGLAALLSHWIHEASLHRMPSAA